MSWWLRAFVSENYHCPPGAYNCGPAWVSAFCTQHSTYTPLSGHFWWGGGGAGPGPGLLLQLSSCSLPSAPCITMIVAVGPAIAPTSSTYPQRQGHRTGTIYLCFCEDCGFFSVPAVCNYVRISKVLVVRGIAPLFSTISFWNCHESGRNTWL